MCAGCISEFSKPHDVHTNANSTNFAYYQSFLQAARDTTCWQCPPYGGTRAESLANAANRFVNVTETFFSSANGPCSGAHSTARPSPPLFPFRATCWHRVVCAFLELLVCSVCARMPRKPLHPSQRRSGKASSTRVHRLRGVHQKVLASGLVDHLKRTKPDARQILFGRQRFE